MARNFFKELIRGQHHLLFVDTETTGIPVDLNRSYKDIDNWPSICQISWLIYNKSGTIYRTYDYKTSNKLLITNSYSNSSTEPTSEQRTLELYDVLPIFVYELIGSDAIIGHNIEYDVKVILCELYRLGLDSTVLLNKPQFCTMKNSVEICGFETTQGVRFPKLQELYTKLFHRPFENAHDAFYDISATAKCFWEMLELNPFIAGDYPILLDDKKKELLAKLYVKKAQGSMTDGRLTPDSYKFYEKAADLGDLHSQHELAWTYIYQKGKKDRAEQLLRILQKKGEARAYLGLAYLLPDQKDGYYNEWREYCYKHFNELNEDDCRSYITALMYGYYETPKDLSLAKRLCQRAIEKGYEFNRLYPTILKLSGDQSGYFNAILSLVESDKKKREESYASWSKMETNNVSTECGNYYDNVDTIIECYFYGRGTRKDLYQAWKWIEEATKWSYRSNHYNAYYYYGQFYEHGLLGTEVSLEKAFECYNRCKSFAPAALQLGIFYLNGYGCSRDKKKAKEYLLMAQKEGYNVDEYLRKANSWFF